MFERYTRPARDVVFFARQEASRFRAQQIEVEHLLLSLVRDTTVKRIIGESSVEDIRNDLLNLLGAHSNEPELRDIRLSKSAKMALAYAAAEADRLDHEHIGSEHLLLGLLNVERSDAASLLNKSGLTPAAVRAEIESLLPKDKKAKAPARSWFSSCYLSLLGRFSSRGDEEMMFLHRWANLVGRGKHEKAFKLLDSFLAGGGDNRIGRIKAYASHGAVVALAIGDLPSARKYCGQSLSVNPDDMTSLLFMATVLDRQGARTEAKKYALRCYQFAAARNDSLSRNMLDTLDKRFSHLGPFS